MSFHEYSSDINLTFNLFKSPMAVFMNELIHLSVSIVFQSYFFNRSLNNFSNFSSLG